MFREKGVAAVVAMWLRYKWLTDQPDGNFNKLGKFLARLTYITLLIIVLYFCWQLAFEADNTNVEVKFVSISENAFRIPDVILCPRDKWAVEEQDIYQVVFMPKRHLKYKYNVWYNFRLVDLLQMMTEDVDELTALAKDNAPQIDTVQLPQKFHKYMESLKVLVSDPSRITNNSQDLWKERQAQLGLAESLNQTAPTEETLTRQIFLFTDRHRDILLASRSDQWTINSMWSAIISYRFGYGYSAAEGKKIAPRRWSQFNRKPNATFNTRAVWLDDTYCWITDNRHNLSYSSSLKNYFYMGNPGSNSDYRVWTGDLDFEQVHWENFMMPKLQPNGLSNNGHTGLLLYTTPYKITNKPKDTISQPLLKNDWIGDYEAKTLDDYWRVSTFEASNWGGQAAKIQVYGGLQEHLDTQKTMTDIQIGELIVGLLGLFLGISILHIVNTILKWLRKVLKLKKSRISFCCF